MASLDKGLSAIRKILTELVEKKSKIDEMLEYIEDEIENQYDDDDYDDASDVDEMPDSLPDSSHQNQQSQQKVVKIVPKPLVQKAPEQIKSQQSQQSQQIKSQQSQQIKSQQQSGGTVVMALKQPTGTASMVSTINPSSGKMLVPVSKKLADVSFVTAYVQDASGGVRTKVTNFIDTCNTFEHLKNNKEKQESVALKIANKLGAPYALKGTSLIIAGKHSAESLKEVFKSLWKPKGS